jgi:hypothetical protein
MAGWHHVIEDVPEFPPAAPPLSRQTPWFVVVPEHKLYQNYPNPWNPETWIPYQLSRPAEVAITIYNMNGQLIKSLDLGYREPGFYISKDKAAYWDGRNDFCEEVASGVYFYTIQAADFRQVKKTIVIK